MPSVITLGEQQYIMKPVIITVHFVCFINFLITFITKLTEILISIRKLTVQTIVFGFTIEKFADVLTPTISPIITRELNCLHFERTPKKKVG